MQMSSLPLSLHGTLVDAKRRIRNDIHCHRILKSIATQTISTRSKAGSSAKRASHKSNNSSNGNSRPNKSLIQRLFRAVSTYIQNQRACNSHQENLWQHFDICEMFCKLWVKFRKIHFMDTLTSLNDRGSTMLRSSRACRGGA